MTAITYHWKFVHRVVQETAPCPRIRCLTILSRRRWSAWILWRLRPRSFDSGNVEALMLPDCPLTCALCHSPEAAIVAVVRFHSASRAVQRPSHRTGSPSCCPFRATTVGCVRRCRNHFLWCWFLYRCRYQIDRMTSAILVHRGDVHPRPWTRPAWSAWRDDLLGTWIGTLAEYAVDLMRGQWETSQKRPMLRRHPVPVFV